jgi:hypothetical protein
MRLSEAANHQGTAFNLAFVDSWFVGNGHKLAMVVGSEFLSAAHGDPAASTWERKVLLLSRVEE